MARIALASYDSSLLRELALKLAENHQVERASTLTGLQKLIDAGTDLIVMTVQLDLGNTTLIENYKGVFTGFALVLHLRAHENNIPIVLVSNFLELPDTLTRLPFVDMYDGTSHFHTPEGIKKLIVQINQMLQKVKKA